MNQLCPTPYVGESKDYIEEAMMAYQVEDKLGRTRTIHTKPPLKSAHYWKCTECGGYCGWIMNVLHVPVRRKYYCHYCDHSTEQIAVTEED